MGSRACVAISLLVCAACGDNEHIGGGQLNVSPQIGLRVNETGTSTTFTIALTNEPHSDVLVDLTSMDTTEGMVSPAQLVFTPADFLDPQMVTVTGVDDERADGNRLFTVRADTERLGAVDIDVVNDDDDSAGFAVSPAIGLMTSEAGTAASFTVRLLSEPAADVTVPVMSSDGSEGVADHTSLVFSTATWNVDQTVTISPQQDTVNDGNIGYTIVLSAAASTDLGYNQIDPDDVQVLNIDDDVFGVAVNAPAALQTSETGAQDSFTVVLQTQPSADVTIPVSSNATDEANVATPSPTASLVFTPQNWDQPQTVTATGVNDDVADGTQPFTVVLGTITSGDTNYNGVNPGDVTGDNTDDDHADIIVSPTSGLSTTEAGGSDTFSVVLESEPTDVVTIAVAAADPTEGTLSMSQIQFTPANWDTAQSITVTGVNDSITDGNQTYNIVLAQPTSNDSIYASINPADVSVTNADDDIPSFTIDTDQLVVSEFGDADQFTIVLNTAPSADVTVPISSSDTTEGTVLPTSVTFTPQNWDVPQTVTVTGINDSLLDGNIDFTIVTGPATSTDQMYAFLNPPDVAVTNIDNDTAQVYVKARKRLQVSESGQSATFRVRLTLQPTAAVTCTLQSNDLTEATVSPMTLNFTTNQYGFQNVTVTGVDDAIIDGTVAVTIILNACTSTDPAYSGVNPRDVTALNRDND